MKHIILFTFLLLSFNVFGDLPKNDLKIKINNSIMQTTESEFNEAIDDVEKLYNDIVEDKYGSRLVINRKWEDDTVNAYTRRLGRTWQIVMFGGLARHPLITQDGFRAVICHELGHQMGGYPWMSSWFGNSWASVEGQSDYFSTAKCLKNIFLNRQDTMEKYYSEKKDEQEEHAASECDKVFGKNTRESMACYRATVAGISLANLLNSLRENTTPVSLLTPDTTVVNEIYEKHPNAQCRLDTYFAGALCDDSPTKIPAVDDWTKNYCIRENGYTFSARPLCWWKSPRN